MHSLNGILSLLFDWGRQRAAEALSVYLHSASTLKHNDEGLNVPSGLPCLPTRMAGVPCHVSGVRVSGLRCLLEAPRIRVKTSVLHGFFAKALGVDGQRQSFTTGSLFVKKHTAHTVPHAMTG